MLWDCNGLKRRRCRERVEGLQAWQQLRWRSQEEPLVGSMKDDGCKGNLDGYGYAVLRGIRLNARRCEENSQLSDPRFPSEDSHSAFPREV